MPSAILNSNFNSAGIVPGAICRALSIALISLVSSALEAAAIPLTRDAAIQTAIRNNRDLAVAALELDRAKARLRWAGLLPNPEIEFAANSDFIGNNDSENAAEIGFSQRFPVTSRLKKEKALRRRDLELAEIEFAARHRQLASEVDRAWLTLSAVKNLEALQQRLLGLNQDIVSFLSGRAKVGEVSTLDVTQAELNGKRIEQQLNLSHANVVTAGAKFKQLIGVGQKVDISITDSPRLPASPPGNSVSFKDALKNRPDFVALIFQANVSQAQLELAIAQRWDDIAVKVFLETENSIDEPDGLDRNSFAGIGVSIPLPWRNKNQEAIEQARINIEAVQRARAAREFAIRSELEAALQTRDIAYRLAAEAGGEVLRLAEQNFDAFTQAQQNGQASLLQVQQAQQQMLELETSAVELRAAYAQADAEVRFIGGTYPIQVVSVQPDGKSNASTP